ncbi:lipopolysaccharide assembly protein LapB [Agrobacterium sp. T29]|uniref:tetratricopeptide repeat protein n=1 Tax=Agrobacterium sp. T29 TaxID=2580515 RepID=UPI00115E62E3|nr:hypothetical protein [Agrobacterium sp. T29]
MRLTSWAMRSSNVSPTPGQLDQLIEIADFHPYNIYEMKDRVSEIGVDAFLSDTSSFQAWKHKQTSGYLRTITLTDTEIKILSALLFAPELDFGSLVNALGISATDASSSIQLLVDQHLLRFSDDRFSISPPLRVAVERDPRIKISPAERSEMVGRLAKSLTIAMDDGSVPVSLADAAIMAVLEAGTEMGPIANALLLPSHRVWLARRYYDAANWKDSLRLSQDAVKDRSRLSAQGFMAACRLLCLSAARLNKQEDFEEGIAKLKAVAKDDWSRSNILFLKGFNERLQGRVFEAEALFKDSYQLNDNDRSTSRELASICLITGDDVGAEKYARKAYEKATNNLFTIDILISSLVRSLGARCVGNIEVEELLSRLSALDDEEQKSFSHTRKAEIELLYGNPDTAHTFIKEAMHRTPYLFEPKLLNARILLKKGNKPAAKDEIQNLEFMTSRHGQAENKAHRRQVLILKSEYLVETRQFKDARDIYKDDICFSEADRVKALKEIDMAEAFVNQKPR